jgi:hypothetical protein
VLLEEGQRLRSDLGSEVVRRQPPEVGREDSVGAWKDPVFLLNEPALTIMPIRRAQG